MGRPHRRARIHPKPHLFGGDSGAMEIPEPPVPVCEEWEPFDKLAREKEVVGVYLSGHPWTSSRCSSTNSARRRIGQSRGPGAPAAHHFLRRHGHRGRTQNRQERPPLGRDDGRGLPRLARMPFWREDYLKFKGLHDPGWFLFIKGKVQMKQFRGADELEFKVTRIELFRRAREAGGPAACAAQPQKSATAWWRSVRLDRVPSKAG